MPDIESLHSPPEAEHPTTVLDAYEAVMSLGEEAVSKLAMSVWNNLLPQEREELRGTARLVYPDIARSAYYAQQLLIFTYVNRAHGEPLNPHQENTI